MNSPHMNESNKCRPFIAINIRCGMTHSRATDMTHSYVTYSYVTWLIHMWRILMWCDSFIIAAFLCGITHLSLSKSGVDEWVVPLTHHYQHQVWMSESCQSRMSESWHRGMPQTWLNHVTYGCATYELVMSITREWVMSHRIAANMNESRHVWMRHLWMCHVTYECIMYTWQLQAFHRHRHRAGMNESYVSLEWGSHVSRDALHCDDVDIVML